MPTALLSAYDKTGVVEFASFLFERGWNLIASRGTAKQIAAERISVRDVADVIRDSTHRTIQRLLDRVKRQVDPDALNDIMRQEQVGEPILNHRVVTLSREIHGGLLASELDEDQVTLERQVIPWINIVYVNLYPLLETIRSEGVAYDQVLEMTDIGGPAMLMAGVKGQRLVICDRADLRNVMIDLRDGDWRNQELRRGYAAKAAATVAAYYLALAKFQSYGTVTGSVDPSRLVITCNPSR